jgi:hypothetical protein
MRRRFCAEIIFRSRDENFPDTIERLPPDCAGIGSRHGWRMCELGRTLLRLLRRARPEAGERWLNLQMRFAASSV